MLLKSLLIILTFHFKKSVLFFLWFDIHWWLSHTSSNSSVSFLQNLTAKCDVTPPWTSSYHRENCLSQREDHHCWRKKKTSAQGWRPVGQPAQAKFDYNFSIFVAVSFNRIRTKTSTTFSQPGADIGRMDGILSRIYGILSKAGDSRTICGFKCSNWLQTL